MLRLALSLMISLSLVALPGRARANDGVAGLDTGALVFLNTEDVAMEEEDLYLSRNEIRVRYLFRNLTDAPVTLLVAFPLPPISNAEDFEYGLSPVQTDAQDLVNFHAWIDGAPIEVARHLHATNETGEDVTALLTRWGLPVNFIASVPGVYQHVHDQLAALPEAGKRQLADAQAIYYDGTYIAPAWTAHLAYFWSMTFPPGETTEVRHSYNPVVDAFVFSRGGLDAGYVNEEACLDQSFLNAARRKLSPPHPEFTTAYMLRYILTTAGTWAGPIGRFHLTVDKGDPAALVSLCRDGIVKTGPTTFEWEARNWRPERDLALFFLDPPQE